MAIFGSLADMPLTDLLPMLGRRNGVLEIWDLSSQKSASLWLESGVLRGAKLSGDDLEPNAAKALLLDLLKSENGNFEFNMGQPSVPCQFPLDWTLEQILNNSVLHSEAVGFTPQLPDPETQFQAINLEVWLEEPLFSFWQQAKPLLASGASANQISRRLGLPLEKVRLYLHKLRITGRVGPVRAFQVQPTTEERKSLVSRLLDALFRRWS